MTNEFARVVVSQQEPASSDQIRQLASVRNDKLIPQIEDAELRLVELRKNRPLKSESSAEEEALRKEIDRLHLLYNEVTNRLWELDIAADTSRIVIQIGSDGIASRRVESSGSQAIVNGLQFAAIAAAIAWGIVALRRHRTVLPLDSAGE